MKTMKSVTIDHVMAWKPCGYNSNRCTGDYNRRHVQNLFGDRESLTALDILNHDKVPDADKVWAVIHKEFMTEIQMHEFACDCAEHVLLIMKDVFDSADLCSAIEATRKWIRGEITEGELYVIRNNIVSTLMLTSGTVLMLPSGTVYDLAIVASNVIHATFTQVDPMVIARVVVRESAKIIKSHTWRVTPDTEITGYEWQIQRLNQILEKETD